MATWIDSVKQMANFYQTNVHTYQGTTAKPRIGRKAYNCPLLGSNVYDDCSGFTSACLQLMGVFPRAYVPTSGYFTDPSGQVASYLKQAGFTAYPFNINSLQPFDIVAMNGHVEIFAGYVGSSKKSYTWGNIHDMSRGGLPSGYCSNKYKLIWRNNGVNIDTPIQLNMSMQEQMNAGYRTGGTTSNNLQFSYDSNTYPVHTEYDTFSGNGGKSVFELVDENALRIGSLNITEGVRDTSVYHTRIFSTNDASIVLDELSLPYDVSINDTWAGKEENNTETDNSIQAQPTNLSENQTNS